MIRAVLDSSALVAGWSRRSLILVGSRGLFQPIWSEWIIGETWRVLTNKRLKRGDNWADISTQANQMMRLMLPVMEMQSIRILPSNPPWPGAKDVDDWPIHITADLAKADYVVSDNTRDFPPLGAEVAHGQHKCRRNLVNGLEYLTSIEFFETVLQIPPAAQPIRPIHSARTCLGK